MNLPVAGLSITDGSTSTLAITTTPAKLVAWSAAGGNKAPLPTEGITQADQTNNRLLVGIGFYSVELDLTLIGSGTSDIIAQIYKNGVKVADASARINVTAAGRTMLSISPIIQVTAADFQKIPSFADPPTPPSKFVGQGGAPDNVTPLEVFISAVSGTNTLTIEAGRFTAFKIG